MKKIILNLDEIMLAGIKIRTGYQEELSWETGRIFPCVREYFHSKLFDKILHRKKPGTTFCVYTEYESDHRGQYTYFIGEEVVSDDPQADDITTLIIPSQNYAKFTTMPAPMPAVVADAWQMIWQMSPQSLGGQRHYHTDFEIYDERANDHQNIVLDLYIGLK